jgi:hypothetical protein
MVVTGEGVLLPEVLLLSGMGMLLPTSGTFIDEMVGEGVYGYCFTGFLLIQLAVVSIIMLIIACVNFI